MVLFQICLVLIPSSSRRGGSSSNPPGILPELENWGGGNDVAAAPTSKERKGIPGFEERGD